MLKNPWDDMSFLLKLALFEYRYIECIDLKNGLS